MQRVGLLAVRFIWDSSDVGKVVAGVYRDFGDLALACLEQRLRLEHGLLMTIC